MNLTVVDHVTEGRQTLARAEKLAAENSPLARREAAAMRTAQVMKSEALMGESTTVRRHACPSCGCSSLLPRKGLVFCVNRHCAPAGVQRRWTFRDLAFAGPGKPGRVHRSSGGAPRDVMDTTRIVMFFAGTAHPFSPSTLRRLAQVYALPSWQSPGNARVRLFSLSDVLSAHAVHMAGRAPQGDCSTPTERAACSGLADLFFGETDGNEARVAAAKDLCASCPLLESCLEQALEVPLYQQYGVAGGMTAAERRELLRARKD